MTWRVVLRLYNRTERIMDVRDVRAPDPDVLGWRYWRLSELPPVRSVCPRCGTRYRPGRVSATVCQCGSPHIEYGCHRCRTRVTDPPYGEGCDSIPFDLEGVNERHRRGQRRWRRCVQTHLRRRRWRGFSWPEPGLTGSISKR